VLAFSTEHRALMTAVQSAAQKTLNALNLRKWNDTFEIKFAGKVLGQRSKTGPTTSLFQREQTAGHQPATTWHHKHQHLQTTTHTYAIRPYQRTHPPAKKQKLRAPTYNQFNRVTYVPYHTQELLSTAYENIRDDEAQQTHTHSEIETQSTKP
jgi:hypothetical protein